MSDEKTASNTKCNGTVLPHAPAYAAPRLLAIGTATDLIQGYDGDTMDGSPDGGFVWSTPMVRRDGSTGPSAE